MPADERDGLIHNYDHAADRWPSWPGHRPPPGAILARMARVARNQQDRERRLYGYLDLGGEAGDPSDLVASATDIHGNRRT